VPRPAPIAAKPAAACRAGVAIFGPTSSGKTDLSLQVAELAIERGLVPVVLNADSRQIYTGMDIGTSKITPDGMRGIEHRLIDIADPMRKFSLERYLAVARRELDDLLVSPRSLPILVGGTGTYIEGLVAGWDVSGFDSNRKMLEAEFPRSERADAHRLLSRLDPGAAARIHSNNLDAILDALARSMSSARGVETPAAWNFVLFGIDRGAAETERRIEGVLRSQLDRGLLDEVARLDERLDLREQHRSDKRPRSVVLETHGYREFVEAAVASGVAVQDLDGPALERAVDATVIHIQAYSRRQRGMFKKLPLVAVRSSYTAVAVLDRALKH